MRKAFCSVAVEHILSPKNAMSPMEFDLGTYGFASHRSTNLAKYPPLTQLVEQCEMSQVRIPSVTLHFCGDKSSASVTFMTSNYITNSGQNLKSVRVECW